MFKLSRPIRKAIYLIKYIKDFFEIDLTTFVLLQLSPEEVGLNFYQLEGVDCYQSASICFNLFESFFQELIKIRGFLSFTANVELTIIVIFKFS